jgi:hypothetical protein
MDCLTWRQVMMFHDHAVCHLNGKEYVYDEHDPEPLKEGLRQPDGSMVYSK